MKKLITFYLTICCVLIGSASLSAQSLDLVELGTFNLNEMTKVVDRPLHSLNSCKASVQGYKRGNTLLFIRSEKCWANIGNKKTYIHYVNDQISGILTQKSYLDTGKKPVIQEKLYEPNLRYFKERISWIPTLNDKMPADKKWRNCYMQKDEDFNSDFRDAMREAETLVNRMYYGKITRGQYLYANQKLWSADGKFFAIVQVDGNLCTYTKENKFIWCSGSSTKNTGEKVSVQLNREGYLSVSDNKGTPIWRSHFENKRRIGIAVHVDYLGKLRIKNETRSVWSSGSSNGIKI